MAPSSAAFFPETFTANLPTVQAITSMFHKSSNKTTKWADKAQVFCKSWLADQPVNIFYDRGRFREVAGSRIKEGIAQFFLQKSFCLGQIASQTRH
jgi:hypothetical protein